MRILWMLILSIGSLTSLKAQDDFAGMASYYADKFVGRSTASGETYQHNKYTCAHKTLPFGTKLRVTNPDNNVSVVVVVNDRGPFVGTRILDVSKSVAQKLGMIQKGVAYLEVEIITDEFLKDADEENTTEILDIKEPEGL